MDSLKGIISSFDALIAVSNDFHENWENAYFSGGYADSIYDILIEILEFSNINEISGVSLKIDKLDEDIGELYRLKSDLEELQEWSVHIHKPSMLGDKNKNITTRDFLFFKIEEFIRSSKEIVTLECENNIFMRDSRPVKIQVNGLHKSFGGERIAVTGIGRESTIPDEWPIEVMRLPTDETIKKYIHNTSSVISSLSPRPFSLSWGDLDSEFAIPFKRLFLISLCSCIVNEYNSKDRVILDGARHIEIPLIKDSDVTPEFEKIQKIKSAVEWIFQEKPDTRLEIIIDRLTLDIERFSSLTSGCIEFIEDAKNHSVRKYRFIIRERKDEYAKELGSLLKDLRLHADLYAEKIRSLLSGLLRDTLAAFLLISLGLASKFGKNSSILFSMEADFLFKAFSVYLISSAFLQIIINAKDISSSKKEMLYWNNVARNHMAMEDVKEHLDNSLRSRNRSYIYLTCLILFVYLVLSIVAWKFQCLMTIFGFK